MLAGVLPAKRPSKVVRRGLPWKLAVMAAPAGAVVRQGLGKAPLSLEVILAIGLVVGGEITVGQVHRRARWLLGDRPRWRWFLRNLELRPHNVVSARALSGPTRSNARTEIDARARCREPRET